jgi:hypothetical protein
MMNPDQCHDFCKLFVKGMVQVQAPWTGREAPAAPVVSRQPTGVTLDVPASSAQSEFNYLSDTSATNGFYLFGDV